jgi:hypothetical protein
MLFSKRISVALMLTAVACLPVNACSVGKTNNYPSSASSEPLQYSWTKVTDGAAFPGAYNFPVFTVRNQMWAFHHQGNWYSTDGRNWTKSELPVAGLNSGYQRYVQFNDAVYALGTMEGNYTNMRLSSRIARTSDFKRWEVLAETSDLPARVFYGAVVFNGEIWLLGGFDGKNYYNDVWNSSDCVHWTRVAEHAAWSPRNVPTAVVFNNRIWVIGGGVIDGTPKLNEREGSEIWSSVDGLNWTRLTDQLRTSGQGMPIVFDGKLWLIGANRDGNFARSSLVTEDGVTWKEESAPWSPRGGVAAWIFDNKLYMTGGKYSVTENGNIRFIYSNDVWYMARSRT